MTIKNIKWNTASLADSRILRQFLSVHEYRNFSRAAEACHLTQQAVSKTILKLERDLGVPLFDRNAFGAEPTIYADALARHAKLILAETRLITSELDAIRGSYEGELRVGLGYSFASRVGPRIIQLVIEQRPKIRIKARVGFAEDLFAGLISGELDVALVAPDPRVSIDPLIETNNLHRETNYVFVRSKHPLARKDKVALEDLSDQTWVVSRGIAGRWEAICDTFTSNGVTPPVNNIDTSSLLLGCNILLTQDCVTILPKQAIENEVERGDMVPLDVPEFVFSHQAMHAVRKRKSRDPATDLFLQLAEQECLGKSAEITTSR